MFHNLSTKYEPQTTYRRQHIIINANIIKFKHLLHKMHNSYQSREQRTFEKQSKVSLRLVSYCSMKVVIRYYKHRWECS